MGFLLSAVLAAPALAQTPQLVTEEMMVRTGDPGIEIYVRNKRPANMTSFRPEQTVLYVHGATYPSETAFDLKLDGLSWMEYIASRGYDVWLLDLRGYGKSTRPMEMAEKPEANPPRRNSSAICRSLPAQNGHEPWSDRLVRFGETPTPKFRCGDAR